MHFLILGLGYAERRDFCVGEGRAAYYCQTEYSYFDLVIMKASYDHFRVGGM